MNTDDAALCFSSANHLSGLIRQKKISCTELMQIYLRRIARVNPTVNAIVQHLAPEEALKQAKHADEQLAVDATAVGPLHGLPITVKDTCKVKGLLVSKGSLGYHIVSDEDATLVARLKAAGAIVVGVTNVPELSLAYETDNDRYGKTLNPYHLEHTPGGSSGGEAAIVAVGGSVLGLGSDMLGSIRQPAHNTGIAGLKPTRGFLPSTGHIPDDGRSPESLLLSYGPMARFVDDLILVLPLLANPDVAAPDAPPSGPPPIRLINDAQLTSLRIVFYADNGIAKPDEATLQTIQKAMSVLQAEVDQLVEHCPAQLVELYTLITEVFALKGDQGLSLQTFLRELGVQQPSALVQAFLAAARGCTLSVADRQQRLHRIDQLRTELERFFMPYDAIICPVAATPAKRHGRSISECHDFSYLSVYNLMGWPALTVRCGTSAEGLPIGLQIIAKPWQDMTVLSIGKKLETLLGGWQPPPLFS